MICRIFTWLVRIDWRAPLTTGGGPALDRALYPNSPSCLP